MAAEISDMTNALYELSKTNEAFVALARAKDVLIELKADIENAKGDKAELFSGLQELSGRYFEVNAEATNVVASLEKTASDIIDTLPELKESVEQGNAKLASVYLEKCNADMEPVVTRFGHYIEEHNMVRKEVEEFAKKASELKGSAKWKANQAGGLGGSLVGGSMLSTAFTVGSLLAVPIGGGTAAALAARGGAVTVASGAAGMGLIAYSDTMEKLKKNFARIGEKLQDAIIMLKKQVESFKNIQEALKRAATSCALMQALFESGEKVKLLKAIDTALEKFSVLQQNCSTYLIGSSSCPLASSCAQLTIKADASSEETPVIDLD